MSKEIVELLPKELQTSFYRDNPKKIFVLSMISCGFYDLLWFYRHWRHFKRRAIGLNEINQQELNICSKDKDIIPEISKLMETSHRKYKSFKTPIKVDFGGGLNWGEAH